MRGQAFLWILISVLAVLSMGTLAAIYIVVATPPASAQSICQKYWDKAIEAAEHAKDARGDIALSSLAWSAIYRNCMGR